MSKRLKPLAVAVIAATCAGTASAREVCRYAGTTDHAGHVTVVTDAATADGVTTVDVKAVFEASPLLWPAIRYQVEELTTWRGGALEAVAVNNRYFAGGHVVRQQWDLFDAGGNGLRARRVQSKSFGELAHDHPGFASHWDPADFGAPWIGDYSSALPERRPDLDLSGSGLTPGLRSPLAMAFFWVRSLPHEGENVPVFLPGFKARQVVVLPIKAEPWAGGLRWRTPLQYPALKERPASTATAWTSTDGHLLQLAFELHSWSGSARGLIHQEGCDGTSDPAVD